MKPRTRLVTWDKVRDNFYHLGGISSFTRETALRSIYFLRRELGETFLQEGAKRDHPLVNIFEGPSPYFAKFVIWLASAIDESSKWSGHDVFLRKLRVVEDYSEAVSVLEIAWKFSRFGFKVSLEPNIHNFPKKPDIKLIDETTRDTLYIEVSDLDTSSRSLQALRTFDTVSDALPRTLSSLGTLYKGLSQQHSRELANKIRRLSREAQRTQSLQQLVERDVIAIAIAPSSEWKSLTKWARARKISTDGFSSPDIPVGDEVIRTALKIEKEQKQLPPNRLGLVIINNHALFLQLGDGKMTASNLLRGLEESVFSHSNLVAVAVFGTFPGPESRRTFLKDQHVLHKWNRGAEFVEYCAVLHNRFCNMKIAASTMTRMDSALKFNIIP